MKTIEEHPYIFGATCFLLGVGTGWMLFWKAPAAPPTNPPATPRP